MIMNYFFFFNFFICNVKTIKRYIWVFLNKLDHHEFI